MKVVTSTDTIYLLRFDLDEDVIKGIINFCTEKEINSGFFSGLGACKKVILSYYDLEEKVYLDKEYLEDLEIVSLTGNVASLESNLAVHAHGVVSDKTYVTYGGHVKELIVSATCEIHLTKLRDKILRKYDTKTGLNLLD